MTVDLHVHTIESDGSLSVSEVLHFAAESKISILSLTDHETTNGIAEAMRLGKSLGVTVIPGLELVTAFRETEIHVLGYFREEDIRQSALQTRL